MEYILFILTILGVLLFIFVQGKLLEKKEMKLYIKSLQNMKGKMPEKDYKIERFLRIPGYFEKHKSDVQIDDITWNDLSMDDIFMRMNYSTSATGEEYLYYLLRTPLFEQEKLKHFDDVVKHYSVVDEDRVKYQWLMKRLGTTGKYSLYDYLDYLEKLTGRNNKKDLLMYVVLIGLILLGFFEFDLGLTGCIIWLFYQMFSYFKVKKENEPYLTSLAYIMRLIDISEKTIGVLPSVCSTEKEQIRECVKQLKNVKKGSFWIFGSIYKTGSPLDAIFDYLRMTFHFDLIYFNHMLTGIMDKKEIVDKLIENLGWLEATISVGLYRASLNDGWNTPLLGEEVLSVTQGYHPLITAPVKNSITAKGSVLLTGSNASGKSTFLKMMALNALLAQTVYTVTADEYKAPFYHLYSSMSLRDDLDSGESYYIVEIKSIKRIMDSKSNTNGKILCFVDEVLRGTNTVERIAASTQILLSMTGDKIQCFAATHDIELTQLLEEKYDNYHFEEEIKNNDVLFNYELKPGKATSRNAIKLLEIMGYESSIIDKARQQAEFFVENGIWRLS